MTMFLCSKLQSMAYYHRALMSCSYISGLVLCNPQGPERWSLAEADPLLPCLSIECNVYVSFTQTASIQMYSFMSVHARYLLGFFFFKMVSVHECLQNHLQRMCRAKEEYIQSIQVHLSDYCSISFKAT